MAREIKHLPVFLQEKKSGSFLDTFALRQQDLFVCFGTVLQTFLPCDSRVNSLVCQHDQARWRITCLVF